MIIGVTGGMGSGKTTVLNMFKNYGVATYMADTAGKELMASSAEVKQEIINAFGKEAYCKNGKVNKSYLAAIVFKDAEKLKTMNGIIHPRVRAHFFEFVKKQTAPYVLFESAILFEGNADKFCDYTIAVTAPLDLRIKRLLADGKFTKNQIELRLKNQMNTEKQTEKANFIIENTAIEQTKNQVKTIHKQLMGMV